MDGHPIRQKDYENFMKTVGFETIAQAAVALKLDFSSEEFAGFAEDHGLSEDEIEVVRSVFAYLKEKKQQTTVMTLLKIGKDRFLSRCAGASQLSDRGRNWSLRL